MSQTNCSHSACAGPPVKWALVVNGAGDLTERAYCKEHVTDFGISDVVASSPYLESRSLDRIYEKCNLRALLCESDSNYYTLVMKGSQSGFAFVSPIGYPEASWIWHLALKTPHAGVATHELIKSIVESLKGSLREAIVHDFDREADAYSCHLTIESDRGDVNVRCRVSDAVAISLVAQMPVKIDTAFLGTDPLRVN
jgi:bifunctional DNase/RNase